MSELVIKKYPNRRLYDTSESRYVTLDDIRELVMQNRKFKVIDARSEEDMTCYVLLQIISEEEAGKFPIFTPELLQQIIRFYGSPMQKNITQYLEKSLAFFNQNFQQDKSVIDTVTGAFKENMDRWQGTMTDMFQNFQSGLKTGQNASAPRKPKKKKKK